MRKTLSEAAREVVRVDNRERASRPLALSADDVRADGDGLVRRLSAAPRNDDGGPYTREDMIRDNATRGRGPLALTKDAG